MVNIQTYNIFLRKECLGKQSSVLRIVIRNGKISLKIRAKLLIFLLELEISGVAVQSIHQKSKKWQL